MELLRPIKVPILMKIDDEDSYIDMNLPVNHNNRNTSIVTIFSIDSYYEKFTDDGEFEYTAITTHADSFCTTLKQDEFEQLLTNVLPIYE